MANYFYKKSAIIVIVLLTVYLIIWNSFIYSFTRKKNLRNEIDKNQLVVKGVVISTLENYLPSHYEEHFFNSVISDSISTDRSLEDTRNPSCNSSKYYKEEFGKTSVIISFHNEAISTLLRTITSIINRTPTYLLEEIILIDDNSKVNYSSMLENLPKVKFYRNDKRQGLIRSRNNGAKLSVGEFLFFLDSHCEVNISWLEPLLQEVISNPGVAVSPVIDNIDGNTFQYKGSFDKLKGGFDWNLQFKWIAMSEEEKDHRILHENEILPYMSPTTSGGVFLISRKWFFELEGFNSGLEIWGGESLELSLKIWLCGGQIEIAPCSRVGHVFRDKYPYDFPLGILKNHLRNSKIIVESWFDDYKYFFYSTHNSARNIEVKYENTQIFKDKMQCRHFSWYIQNIFPELRLPNEKYLAYGQLKHGSLCLDIYPQTKKKPLKLNECTNSHRTKWILDIDNILSTENGACLNVEENNLKIEYCKLSKDQKWHRSGGNLIHTHSGKCLENLIRSSVGVSNCRKGALSQLWSFSIELEHY